MFVNSLPSIVSSNSHLLAQLNNRHTFLITTAANAALQGEPDDADTAPLNISAIQRQRNSTSVDTPCWSLQQLMQAIQQTLIRWKSMRAATPRTAQQEHESGIML